MRFCTLIAPAAVLVLLSAGCGRSSAPRLHVLTSTTAAPARRSPVLVGIGPISFPKYLARRDVVRRGQGSELETWPRHEWAEPLEDGFARVLGENIASMARTGHVVLYPWDDEVAPELAIRLRVLHFEATPGGVILDVMWGIQRNGDDNLRLQRSRYRLEADPDDADVVVRAMSSALESFARDVSAALGAARSASLPRQVEAAPPSGSEAD